MEQDTAFSSGELPLACKLPTSEQALRAEEVTDLLKAAQQVDELADGYAFRYPSSDIWANRLLQFIVRERSCCPFFTFELLFVANQGPIWLHMRGPGQVKEFIRDAMMSGD